jgi:hypothetical protein
MRNRTQNRTWWSTVGGMGNTPPSIPTPPDSPPLSDDWTSVAAQASPAVMLVEAVGDGFGTGFQVDTTGTWSPTATASVPDPRDPPQNINDGVLGANARGVVKRLVS